MNFITQFFSKRSNPAPTYPYSTSFLGGLSNSSVNINETTALQTSAVWACVRILSESVAMLPLNIYQYDKNGGTNIAYNHSLYSVLHDQSNSEMSAFVFRETMMSHLLLYGNCYGQIIRDQGGRVKELWPIRPELVHVIRDPNTQEIDYVISPPTKPQYHLKPEEVLHIQGLSPDGLIGYSPIRMAREAIGLSLATEEYGSRFFSNGASISGVLEYPGQLTPDAMERIKTSWNEQHTSIENAHKISILQEGMKFTPCSIPPEDSQFLETRKFQINDIARIFRVPPHMIGELDRATFSNIEQQSMQFVNQALMSWLVRWEQAIQVKLLSPQEKKRYFTRFDCNALLRGDITSRYNAYKTGVMYGWLSANDVRSLEDMNPIPDGDKYLVPLNMGPLEAVKGETQSGGDSNHANQDGTKDVSNDGTSNSNNNE